MSVETSDGMPMQGHGVGGVGEGRRGRRSHVVDDVERDGKGHPQSLPRVPLRNRPRRVAGCLRPALSVSPSSLARAACDGGGAFGLSGEHVIRPVCLNARVYVELC